MDTVGHIIQVIDGLIYCYFENGETKVIGGN